MSSLAVTTEERAAPKRKKPVKGREGKVVKDKEEREPQVLMDIDTEHSSHSEPNETLPPSSLPSSASNDSRQKKTQVAKAAEEVGEETRYTPPGRVNAEYLSLKTDGPTPGEPKKKAKFPGIYRPNLAPLSLHKVVEAVLSQGYRSPARTPVSRTRSLSSLNSVASKVDEVGNHDLNADVGRRSAQQKGSGQKDEEEPPPQKEKKASRPRYSFIVQLGDGAHGEVWLCKDPEGAQYAVKTLKPAKPYDRHKKARYIMEKKILHVCRDDPECPDSIVKFYETFYHKGRPFEKERAPRLCHCMEYCRGQTLYHTLRGKSLDGKLFLAKKILEGEVVRTICLQILKGLEFLHSKKIVHSDMKPENIMFVNKDEGDYTVRIIDFGLSFELKEDREFAREIGGTPMYHPPEIFLGQRLISAKMDIWAVGIIMWEMTHGLNKFPICPMGFEKAMAKAHGDREKGRRILREQRIRESQRPIRFTTDEWRCIPDAIPLAEGILRKDNASRFTATEALEFVQSPWATKLFVRSKL